MRPALPRLVLMTDAARGDAAASLAALPRGAGVIFRDYERPDRAARAADLRAKAKARGLLFLVGGDPRLAARVKADGFHAPQRRAHLIPLARRLCPRGLVTLAVHDAPGLALARRYRPDAILVSPVFATPSHPGAPTLGPLRFTALATAAPVPVLALGGVTAETFKRLRAARPHGFAGIGFAQKPNEISV